MDAMNHYRSKKQEKRRFEHLLEQFKTTPSIEMKVCVSINLTGKLFLILALLITDNLYVFH